VVGTIFEGNEDISDSLLRCRHRDSLLVRAAVFLIHGANFSLFLEEIFATRISSFFAADLIVASVIFLVWSFRDARERKIGGWWVVLLSNLVVGLSLALPLYFLKRLEGQRK